MKNNKQTKENTYVCPICSKVYEKRKNNIMGCLVIHSGRDCCHFNEKEIIDKTSLRKKKI